MDRAIGEDDLQFFHVMPRGAVTWPMAACGIDGNHAAHGGDAAHSRIGAKEATRPREDSIQRGENDAWLHANSIVFNRENSAAIT